MYWVSVVVSRIFHLHRGIQDPWMQHVGSSSLARDGTCTPYNGSTVLATGPPGPALCDPMDYNLPGSSVHRDSPGKNTGVGCHALLQGIFPTQGSNPGPIMSLALQVGSLPLAPPQKPFTAHTPSHIWICYNLWGRGQGDAITWRKIGIKHESLRTNLPKKRVSLSRNW